MHEAAIAISEAPALSRSRAGPRLSGWLAKHKGGEGGEEGGTGPPDQLSQRHGASQHWVSQPVMTLRHHLK
ncbi:hypothetical protein AOLI_G00025000 [Acnodon oligacanthus]